MRRDLQPDRVISGVLPTELSLLLVPRVRTGLMQCTLDTDTRLFAETRNTGLSTSL